MATDETQIFMSNPFLTSLAAYVLGCLLGGLVFYRRGFSSGVRYGEERAQARTDRLLARKYEEQREFLATDGHK